LPRQQRRRRKGSSQYSAPRKAKPPFPINLLFNVKAFYVFFIVVMIASLAAVGLGSFGGGGHSSNTGVPIVDDDPSAVVDPVGGNAFPDGPEAVIDATQPHMATLKTNQGDIQIELSTEAAAAVNSFAFLAQEGFYEGSFFFFVSSNYFAQAGDPTCNVSGEGVCSGLGSPGYPLPVEETDGGHERWAVVAPAVVEGQEVHGSQFRILLSADERLDGKETVFGKVVDGQEILEGLTDFVLCSVAEVDGCVPTPDVSLALVINEIIVEPA
jgi:cyclophilin family peptidyl-prolyl cis-trans isomerase